MTRPRHRNKYTHVHYGKKSYYAHILKAEKALGHPLPDGAEIHHLNLDHRDDGPGNLVVCPDHAYHLLLHRRTKELELTDYCKQHAASRGFVDIDPDRLAKLTLKILLT